MTAVQAPSTALLMRPVRGEDEPFLFELFAADKREEFAAAGVPGMQAQMLIEIQYRGRKMTYATQYPDAEDSILLDEHEMPVGRLLLHREKTRWRIVDVAVQTAHRGRGLGSTALRNCQARCAEAGARLELSVAKTNVARLLYERLGFCVLSEDATAVDMAWVGEQRTATEGQRASR